MQRSDGTATRGLLRLLVAFLVVAMPLASTTSASAAAERPDVIVIVTDDQRWDTMRYMPLTTAWLGTSFTQAFVSNAGCCPSRTTIFTGAYSHTNGIWTNGGGEPGTTRHDYGGWARYDALGLDTTSIPYMLQEGGYRTGHFGKFLNGFTAAGLDDLPLGWDEFAATGTGAGSVQGIRAPFYDYSLVGRHDGRYTVENYGGNPGDHSTVVLTDKAIGFLETSTQPLLLHLAYNAPHSSAKGEPPIPAEEDVGSSVTLEPLALNVNEADVSDKPAYIRRRQVIPQDAIERWRLEVARSLYGVDRGIDAVLSAQNERDPGLGNTLVIFMSDNGRMDGSHRWMAKGVPYEESIRVPLLVSWSGLAAGTVDHLVGNVDLAATIAEATGVPFDAPDSISLLSGTRTYFVLESVGRTNGHCGVRTASRKYVKYATGEVEFYNLNRGPFELVNHPNAHGAQRLYRIAKAACTGNLSPDWPPTTTY